MALRLLEDIALVFKLLEDFDKVSLLTLKPAQCVILAFVCTNSDWNLDMIRAFLRRVVPLCVSTAIKDCAKYFGFLWERLLEVYNGKLQQNKSVVEFSI